MRLSWQEYWNRLPCPSPGDLPDPRIKLVSPALASRFFTTELPGSGGFSICKTAKILLFLHWLTSPPFPKQQRLESAPWTLGKAVQAAGSQFPITKEWGGHRKSLCPGAPQGPPRYHHQRQFNLEYRRASSGRSCRPEFLYSARIPLKIKAKESPFFSDFKELRGLLTSRPEHQEIFKEILQAGGMWHQMEI